MSPAVLFVTLGLYGGWKILVASVNDMLHARFVQRGFNPPRRPESQ
jgi:hypothetical protein